MRKGIVLAALALCCASVDAKAADTALETALEVQSWCKQIVNAKIGADSRIFYQSSCDTGFCWGAIAAIQDLSKIIKTNDETPMIGVCAPTRLQMIKIFSKYVDDHPETAHRPFTIIARLSLAQAFPCTEGAARR